VVEHAEALAADTGVGMFARTALDEDQLVSRERRVQGAKLARRQTRRAREDIELLSLVGPEGHDAQWNTRRRVAQSISERGFGAQPGTLCAVLTAEERRTFDTRGYVVLERAVDAAAAASMHESIWTLLAERGVRRTDRATWPQGPTSNLRAIRRGDERPTASVPLTAALDGLFGTGRWKPPKDWGQAMVTFPEPGPWLPPRDQWHVDHPFWFPPDEVWGMNVFLFVDEVGEHGGGTLVLEGSPVLVRRFVAGLTDATARPKTLARAFRAEHGWLATTPLDELMVNGVDVDGTRVRVVELMGAPGDAVVCHPWLMHSASPNVTRRPRMMRASRIYRRAAS
jgi:hypothetical protein